MCSGTGPRCRTPSDGLGIDASGPATRCSSIARDSTAALRPRSLHEPGEPAIGEDLAVRLARGAVRDLVALEGDSPHRSGAFRAGQTVAIVDTKAVAELGFR